VTGCEVIKSAKFEKLSRFNWKLHMNGTGAHEKHRGRGADSIAASAVAEAGSRPRATAAAGGSG
jgi:hypothetical protein